MRKGREYRDEHRESLILLGNAVIKRTRGVIATVPFERHFVLMLGAGPGLFN